MKVSFPLISWVIPKIAIKVETILLSNYNSIFVLIIVNKKSNQFLLKNMKSILLLVAIAVVTSANIIRIKNNCSPITIWPGLLNNPGQPLPANGGFQLNVGQSVDITVPSNWAGRIWARTNCDANGHCETGDCGKVILEIFNCYLMNIT